MLTLGWTLLSIRDRIRVTSWFWIARDFPSLSTKHLSVLGTPQSQANLDCWSLVSKILLTPDLTELTAQCRRQGITNQHISVLVKDAWGL